MGVKELIAFLPQHPANQTVYDWVYYDKVPYRKIRKYLLFKQTEIEYWLKTDQVVLFDDLNNAAAKAVEKIRYGQTGKLTADIIFRHTNSSAIMGLIQRLYHILAKSRRRSLNFLLRALIMSLSANHWLVTIRITSFVFFAVYSGLRLSPLLSKGIESGPQHIGKERPCFGRPMFIKGYEPLRLCFMMRRLGKG
jgi:hypothetical protein